MTDLLSKIAQAQIDKGRRKQQAGVGTARFRKNDDRTISKLQEQKFSGIRANELWLRFEIWILGRLEKSVSYQEIFLNTNALEKAYCEVFGIDHINMDIKTKQELQKLEERKAQLSEPEVQRIASQLVDPTMQQAADLKSAQADEAKRSK